MTVNWQHWLDKGDIQKVHVNRKSLADLANLVDRDLNDAQVAALSADRRFAIAYNAALNLANYVIRKNGYRVAAKVGHHRITFLVAGEALGRAAKNHLDYFDLCRRKRNKVDYDLAGVATDKDVAELIKQVMEFKTECGLS
jgi:hypothetical protein